MNRLGLASRRKRQSETGKELNPLEKDFIEFFSGRRQCPKERIRDIFLETRDRFAFAGSGYRELCDQIHHLFRIRYDDAREEELADSYKFHELPHLFRMIGYTYDRCYKKEAESLIRFVDRDPVICVDYGCGLAHLSYELGGMKRPSEIYLVDLDTLILEFCEFRFARQKIDAKVMRVARNNLYPKLPAHNLCIAEEIMEHLKEPLLAYQHIYESLEPGGILYGNFSDHRPEMFHVTPDLSPLRERLSEDFQILGPKCYRKL
jgi:SAM-dependent methyltransferase